MTGKPQSRHAWRPPAKGRTRSNPFRRRASAARTLVRPLETSSVQNDLKLGGYAVTILPSVAAQLTRINSDCPRDAHKALALSFATLQIKEQNALASNQFGPELLGSD